MDRQSEQDRPPPAEQGSETADRLDALSHAAAERVLQRAIELQQQESQAGERLTRTQLAQIASELGIDSRHVEAALVQELTTPRQTPSSARHRLLGPPRITATRVVEGDQATVDRSVTAWMEAEEGFRPRSRTGSGYRWERDDHWSTKLKLSFGGSDSTGSLRSVRSISTGHINLGDGRRVVEIDADTKVVPATAAGVGAGIATAGVLGGLGYALGVPGGSDLVQFLVPAAPAAVVGAGVAVTIGRAWTASIRRGIERALDGIASPQLGRRKTKRRKSTIERLVDSAKDAIDDVFD